MKMSNKESLVIVSPDNNRPERQYAIDSLFSLLDIEYVLTFDESARDYTISYKDVSILIQDSFFSLYHEPLSYLQKDAIPAKTSRLDTDSGNVVVLFGSPTLTHEGSIAVCGADIFAATFFMLSRWEEFVIDEVNHLGKVLEAKLLAVREGFTDRPIVNEYADFLVGVFKKHGHVIALKRSDIDVMLTHDVDWASLSSIRELGKNIRTMVANRQYKRPAKILFRYALYRFRGKNPFDTFDEIMDYSDKYGFKNSFYFKAAIESEPGYTYRVDDPFVVKSIKNIEQRDHFVGFHPSENTLNNQKQFDIEIERLRKVSQKDIKGGRAHHLLYGFGSWQNWHMAGLAYDSSCGFQYRNGFRTGLTSPYMTFDIKKRKELPLKEYPFLLMDSVWLRTGESPGRFYEEAKRLIDIVIRHGGVVCINWHSNLFNAIETKRFRGTYFQIVDYLGEKRDEEQ